MHRGSAMYRFRASLFDVVADHLIHSLALASSAARGFASPMLLACFYVSLLLLLVLQACGANVAVTSRLGGRSVAAGQVRDVGGQTERTRVGAGAGLA